MRLYLTGPITGNKRRRKVTSWREAVAQELADVATIVDPTHANFDNSNYYKDVQTRTKDGSLSPRMRTAFDLMRQEHGRTVIDRNRVMIQNCDVVLGNFMGAKKKASIGSVGELFWANMSQKVIILVREPENNVHDHAMLNAIATRIFHTLDEAIDFLREIATMNEPLQVAGASG